MVQTGAAVVAAVAPSRVEIRAGALTDTDSGRDPWNRCADACCATWMPTRGRPWIAAIYQRLWRRQVRPLPAAAAGFPPSTWAQPSRSVLFTTRPLGEGPRHLATSMRDHPTNSAAACGSMPEPRCSDPAGGPDQAEPTTWSIGGLRWATSGDPQAKYGNLGCRASGICHLYAPRNAWEHWTKSFAGGHQRAHARHGAIRFTHLTCTGGSIPLIIRLPGTTTMPITTHTPRVPDFIETCPTPRRLLGSLRNAAEARMEMAPEGAGRSQNRSIAICSRVQP